MRNGWNYVPLGKACQIKPPKKEAKECLNQTDLVSFVPMHDLGIRKKYFSPVEEKLFGKVSGSYTYFAEGDVLLAKITPCFENGKLGIARGLTNRVGFGSSEFIVFRPGGLLNPEFLFYYLSQDSFRDAGQRVMSGAVGHKRVPKEFIENHLIPLPPLTEQKRIVAILDEAFTGIDAAIANTQKNLANARELFESYLNSMFCQRGKSWIERTLAEVSGISSKLVDPKAAKYQHMLHVGAGNIDSMKGSLVDLQTAKEERLKSGKFEFDETMVLYSKIRPYLMKVVRPDFSGLCSADIYPLSPNNELICRDFLYYLLLSNDFTEYAIAGSARAGMPKVNREHLFAYKTYFPEVEEQRRLVNKLDAVASESQRLESIFQNKLSSLVELKQSLLQKAFSGELTDDFVEKEMDEAVA